MRDDVKAFLALCVQTFDPPGPVLELGALQVPGQEGYADLRPLFPGRAYTGCDVVPGPGVDRVEDAAALGFPDGAAGTVVCADSLEHMADPAAALREMRRVLRADGCCLLAAPFVFPIHHPPDYWRFTPEGLARLLAPFGASAVFSLGDAQWPHTVCAVAVPSRSAAFAARAAALPAAWEASGQFDPLLPFVPLVSVARHDTGDVLLEPLEGNRDVRQAFECGAAGLCRVCVKVDVEGAREGRELALAIADAANPAVVLAEVRTRVHAPVRGRWVAFDMGPLAASAERRLLLRLSAPGDARHARVLPHVARDGTLSFEAFARRSS
ncbi:MAG TPA: methyltransferase domain-containing protein [Candidatus Limnocylindria bacterium]|nr:methyltransferase domain-containing protein [Candidatus Limnocylindria bacterium]